MIYIFKIWLHIMNLYVISFKSEYGTSKTYLKWKRYKPLKFQSKTYFLLKEVERMNVEDNLHITCLSLAERARVVANKIKAKRGPTIVYYLNIVCIYSVTFSMNCTMGPCATFGILVSYEFFCFCFMPIKPIAFVSPLFK